MEFLDSHSSRVDSTLIEGLQKIREAALYQIVAVLLIFIGIVSLVLSGVAIATILPASSSAPGHGHEIMHGLSLGTLIVVIILVIVGAIIALIGVYGKLLPGAKLLAEYNSEQYSTPASLIRIGYLGGLICIIIGVVTLIILIGIFLILIALILLFLGHIGLIILTFRLNSDFEEGALLAAGILFIIGIFIGIADIIAWILVYMGIGSILEKLPRMVSQKQPLPPPPPV